jgi:maltoporin
MDPDVSDNDDEDGGSDSDDEDRVPAHDPNSQTRPKLPIYHPGFKLTEEITQNVLRTFTQFIVQSINDGYTDPEATHLRDEIISKKTMKNETAVRLAVAGDTGVGKSALLNALLGVLNLTIEVC